MDADQLDKRIAKIDTPLTRQEPADGRHTMRISRPEASVCVS